MMNIRIGLTSKSISLAIALLATSTISAGCKTDCEDEYESAREDCNLLHDDPDDADWLQMCLEEAQSEYEDCINECDS